MPAQRLNSTPVDLRQFDVAGLDSADEALFIQHVALCSDHRPAFHPRQTVQLTHMRPPLEGRSEGYSIQTLGTIPLTADEIRVVSIAYDELAEEYRAQRSRKWSQYVIVPHAKPYCEQDGTILYTRFNCAGFIIEMYREAGVSLLATDMDKLPLVSIDVLTLAYPDAAAHLQSEVLRKRFGLEGDGPWPVVMAGYVLNALNRDEAAIRSAPYQAQSGDQYFPPRPPTPQAG